MAEAPSKLDPGPPSVRNLQLDLGDRCTYKAKTEGFLWSKWRKQRRISCARKVSAKSGKQPLTTARNQSYCNTASESLSSARSLYLVTLEQEEKNQYHSGCKQRHKWSVVYLDQCHIEWPWQGLCSTGDNTRHTVKVTMLYEHFIKWKLRGDALHKL